MPGPGLSDAARLGSPSRGRPAGAAPLGPDGEPNKDNDLLARRLQISPLESN